MAAHQAPLSLGFSRQEYWSGLPFPSPMSIPEDLMKCKCHHTSTLWVQVSLYVTQCRRPGFYPWVRKIPWRREWQPTPVSLPGESHGQRSVVSYRVAESDTIE